MTSTALPPHVWLHPEHDDIGHGFDGMMGWTEGWLFVWWILLALVIVTIAVAVIAAFRGFRNGGTRGTLTPSPQDIIDTRLASGEISIEEHRSLDKELRNVSAPDSDTQST